MRLKSKLLSLNAEKTVKVKATLTNHQACRERFWKQLLIAAGLKENLKETLPSDCIHPLAKGWSPKKFAEHAKEFVFGKRST